MSYILHLDDDPEILSLVSELVASWGYEVKSCLNVEQAKKCLTEKPLFAIVDVYLNGASGKELSSQFITEELLPSAIPFGRLTSAPESVEDAYAGRWVLHKYDVRQAPGILEEALAAEL